MKANTSKSMLPYTEILDYLLPLSREKEHKTFCLKAFSRLSDLISFDKGYLFLLDNLQKPFEQYLICIEPYWIDVYLNYYSKIDNGEYNYIFSNDESVDWQDRRDTKIKCELMDPLRIKHTTFMSLYNEKNRAVFSCCINRTGKNGFAQSEKETWSIIHLYLQSMNSSFFTPVPETNTDNRNIVKKENNIKALTATETKILDYLCNGLSAVEIAQKDNRKLRTVYKHIENIYRKLDVSNRQELLIRALDK